MGQADAVPAVILGRKQRKRFNQLKQRDRPGIAADGKAGGGRGQAECTIQRRSVPIPAYGTNGWNLNITNRSVEN
jgi:hypothetical protein